MAWSMIHRRVPNFSVGVHCITIFLVRMVLLILVVDFMKKRGHRFFRDVRTGRKAVAQGIRSLVDFLAVWIPVRLMCPGIMLRIGRWTCAAASALLPPSSDPFNYAAKSYQFWFLYGWAEIFVFGAILVFVWNHGAWAFGVARYNKFKRAVVSLLGGHHHPIWTFLKHLLQEQPKTHYHRRRARRSRSSPSETQAQGSFLRPGQDARAQESSSSTSSSSTYTEVDVEPYPLRTVGERRVISDIPVVGE